MREDAPKFSLLLAKYTFDENNNIIQALIIDSEGICETISIEYKLVYIPVGMPDWMNEIIEFVPDNT